MKYLILFIFFLSPVIVYGQNPDLIVTVNGDSIKCKIVKTETKEIQFRINNGNIIYINKRQVVTYQRNFEQPAPVTTNKKNTPTKNDDVTPHKHENDSSKKISAKLPPFYMAFLAGASTFGTYTVGKVNSGGTFNVSADMAYFFTPSLGVGLKLNLGKCDVDFSKYITYNETLIFIGPALYGRWGTNRVAFTASAGGGSLSWKLSNSKFFDVSKNDESHSSLGGFISAGVNVMFTQNVGVSLNINSILGSFEDEDGYARKPAGLGASLGLNFSF
jgi:hypothetical protein